jgi:hypothetical protein
MAAESKKATENAMREVAAALAEHEHKNSIYFEDDSDTDDSIIIRKKKNVVDKSVLVDKLETRIHYLQLDLANKDVELTDTNNILQTYKEKDNILKKIDDNILLLRNLSFYLVNLENLTIPQIERKLTLFQEESREHATNCLNYLKMVEFQFIKHYLKISLDEINKKNIKIEAKIADMIFYKKCVNELYICLVAMCFLVILYVLYKEKLAKLF